MSVPPTTGPGGPPQSPIPYHGGQAAVPTQPVWYSPPAAPTSPAVGGGDRPSRLAVAAVILFALAVVLCAGLVGYVVRQVVDGDRLSDLFSMITYDLPIEGSMTR